MVRLTDTQMLERFQAMPGVHPLTCGYCREPPALMAPGSAWDGRMQMRCPRCEAVQTISPGAIAAARRFVDKEAP